MEDAVPEQMRICALACLAILLISGAQAAETGGLRGTVRDESGRPVTGAAVKIRHTERAVTVTVFSRAGNYSAPEQWLPPIRVVREAVLPSLL